MRDAPYFWDDQGYSAYSRANARAALPLLTRVAQTRAEPITYGDLAAQLGLHHRAARHFLGCIRDEVCVPNNLPILTALVVNGLTRLPGESFLAEGTRHLRTPSAYRRAFEEHRDSVFQFDGWDEVLRDLDIAPAIRRPEDYAREAVEYERLLGRRGGEAEGKAHRLLKEWVATHPEKLGLPTTAPAIIEKRLPSGDECDVVFDLPKRTIVVEVKNGEHAELSKGVFQVIKYRAVAEASRGSGRPFPTSGMLVAYSIPADIEEFAALFGIKVVRIPSLD